MQNAGEALRQFLVGEIQLEPFLREVASQELWWVPAVDGPQGPEAGVFEDPDGTGRWLLVYTGMETYAEAAPAAPTRVVLSPAQWLPIAGRDGVLGVQIDADCAHRVAIHRETRADRLLAAYVGAVVVELLLDGVPLPNKVELLRCYGGYRLLRERSSGMLLTAGDDGRHMAAVCTAPDATRHIIDASPYAAQQLEVVMRSGGDLFAELWADEGVEGVRFNWQGPAGRREVTRQFFRWVLTGEGDEI